MSDLIEAVSRQVKTMSDGTLRLTVDIPPTSAQDAFKLFGAPDVPMVLARLTQEAAMQSAREEVIEKNKPKGGELAKLAGIFCQEPKFWKWANHVTPALRMHPIDSENNAAEWLRGICGIQSRTDLDINPSAAVIFHAIIRIPYSEWLRKNGG